MRCGNVASAMFVLGVLAAPVLADGSKDTMHHILRLADYQSITGCTSAQYTRSMKSAVAYFAFEGDANTGQNRGLGYARRHTIPVFRDLHYRHAAETGEVETRCIPTSLRRIGFALRILAPNGRFGTARPPALDYVYDPALLSGGEVDARAFPLMSRRYYVQTTGCRVSVETYQKYQQGFEWVVLQIYRKERSRKAMIDFMEDLHKIAPADDGHVDQRCLVPAVSRIAAGFGLLDAHGRYRAGRTAN